jgi:hypothetical protein
MIIGLHNEIVNNNCIEILNIMENNSANIFNTVELFKRSLNKLINLTDDYNLILNNIKDAFVLDTEYNTIGLMHKDNLEPILFTYIEIFNITNNNLYTLLRNSSNIINYKYIHDCNNDLCFFNIYCELNLNMLNNFQNLNIN